MSFPRLVLWGGVIVFAVIGTAAFFKKKAEVDPVLELAGVPPTLVVSVPEPAPIEPELLPSIPIASSPIPGEIDFPEADLIFKLFTTGPNRLSFVETLSYSGSVPWLKDRPAWVADYAAYYNTSRHFIARSLNGKPDYFSQKVSVGSKFNVFRKDKNIEFHLLVDVHRCKMGLYCVDLDTQERLLLKTYLVGLGRPDPESSSGCLTPLGKYSLGSKVAIYKPGVKGYYHDQHIEMISVFGTRWIPFEQELDGCTAMAKGYGLHGAPWDFSQGVWSESRNRVGVYDSDGCIRLKQEDIEEIFAIVISKPAFIWVVNNFYEAKLPGIERGD